MGRFGINEKQATGRVRKAAVEEEKKQKKEQEKEVMLSREWEIGSKDESKKKELESKRLKKLQSKTERREVLEQEETEISKTSKVKQKKGLQKIHESSDNIPSYAANNIDDAIFLMQIITTGSSESVQDIERHPERRMKAAYTEFEDKELCLLKKEYPSLRLSQLKQIVWKKWKKSPDNPFNQPHISYSATKEEREQIHSEVVEKHLERLDISNE